jgi:hypothetical protein
MSRLSPPFFIFFVTCGIHAKELPTHCSPDEKTFFNCQIKNSEKIASVCAKIDETSNINTGTLQYRYGTIDKKELVYPANENASDAVRDRFRYSVSRSADYMFYDMALQFSKDDTAYVLYSGEMHLNSGIRYQSNVSIWALSKPCRQNCLVRAPHQAPDARLVKTMACSNANAGRNLYLNGVFKSPVDLPFPISGKFPSK